MKAIEVLEWICKESIRGELLNIVNVPEQGDEPWEQNEDWWINMFGACPPHSIPAGRYLYYYASQIPYVEDRLGDLPDIEIEVCNTGTMFDCDYIEMFKLDD